MTKTQRRRSGVFIANFEQISHIALVFPFLALNKQMLVWIVITNNKTVYRMEQSIQK